MNLWGAFWAAWGIAGAVVEAAALAQKDHKGKTLSSNLQAIVLRKGVRRLSLVAWGVFSVWFAFHIW